MNNFEFKKLAMSDPYSKDPAFLKKKEECEDCRQYLQSILAFDAQLSRAASVDCAPDDFKARLKLRHVIDRQEQRHKNFRWMSYAASVMLTVVAMFFGVQNYQAEKQVELAGIENQKLNAEFNELYQTVIQLNNESKALTTVQATVQARMQSHLASYAGLKNIAELPGLRFSRICPVGKDKTAWHAVMDHGLGLVTAVYFKDDQMPERSGAEKFDYVKVIKLDSSSVMLLGDSQDAVDLAEEEILESLSDSIAI